MSEIKVGGIYKGSSLIFNETVKIDRLDNDIVSYTVVEDTADPSFVGTSHENTLETFSRYFDPVYTVEGFEV